MKYISVILSVLFLLFGFRNAKSENLKIKPDNNNNKSVKNITAGCAPATASTELDLNNVRALIHTGGDMWWDLQGTAKYEVPAGSGKTALFAGSIWIGGKDVNGNLKLAAQKFRSNGADFWTGPLIISGENQGTVSPEVCRQYDKHFVITKNEVSEFRAWYNTPNANKAELFPGYTIPKIIQDWPAHADYTSGYAYNLAPYVDVDDDLFYNPDNGDYPFYDLDGKELCGTRRELRKVRLYGDKTLWWVYNDRGNIHTETGGDAIGMELHGQAFAFSTNDELNNMTFYNYEIINRSTYTLTNTYFGVWTDADLGWADDDFVGCDVNRGLGYLYNGKAVDGTGQPQAYGASPPAVGIDFFEGPYQDPDGIDNLSNWDPNKVLDCNNGYRNYPATNYDDPTKREIAGASNIENGNINGLNFGDNIIDNERWGMRRFIYFNRSDMGQPGTKDPKTALEHYYYLIGKWKDGSQLWYGGTGWESNQNPDRDTSDFMFPGITDKCNWGTRGVDVSAQYPNGWSEAQEGNPPGDRRIVQSAGPFVLEPGMVNDITTGVVWARSKDGNVASITEVQKADDKAQSLFEACFKVLDGPDSPDLTFIELDKEIIFNISNRKLSNNYLESYSQDDPTIPCPIDPATGLPTNCDKSYKFQGYQIFQLKNKEVSISEIHDANNAKLVFQCDIKDSIARLINYYWNDDWKTNVPVEEVDGNDNGIIHSFRITEDKFALGDKRLVNHKKYYFIALAYAHNNFKTYDQTNPDSLDGQKLQYKAGRKSAIGSIQAVEVIPHIRDNTSNGTIMNSVFGDEPAITQLDGFGCGNNEIDLEDETINQIMNGAPWKSEILKYKTGKGPFKIKVVDPLNVPKGEYILKFIPDSIHHTEGFYLYNTYFEKDTVNYDTYSYITDAKWVLYNKNPTGLLEKFIYSDSWISQNNEQLIPELGISVSIEQTSYSFPSESYANQAACTKKKVSKNGYINSSIEYSNPSKPWLYFLPDGESQDAQNWIRSGTATDSTDCNKYFRDKPAPSVALPALFLDKEQIFEGMVQGTWAPYRLVSDYNHGPTYTNVGQSDIRSKDQRLANVDVIITKDTSLWTRCPVIETTDNKYKTDGGNGCTIQDANNGEPSAENEQKKLYMRTAPSVDKLGNPDNTGTFGMGWFPGYAIDVETGERLNMMFGESSRLTGDSGRDMKWNPSTRLATDLYLSTGGALGEPIMGGKHFIYIMGHNIKNTNTNKYTDEMPAYDKGEKLRALFNEGERKKAFMNCMYVSIPVQNANFEYLACDVKIKLRVVSPYRKRAHTLGFAPDSISPNKGLPMYSFSLDNLATTKNDLTTLQNSLDLINVVPNPYYAHNSYELTQLDYLVKFTNLPQICTISIYSVNGTLIRRFEKDNSLSFVDWDLKNTNGISIAGGVYVIHVDIPGVGERFLKWFGALRPIDLNSF